MQNKTINMNFKLTTRLKEALEVRARKSGLTRSSFLRMQIAETCKDEYMELADKYKG